MLVCADLKTPVLRHNRIERITRVSSVGVKRTCARWTLPHTANRVNFTHSALDVVAVPRLDPVTSAMPLPGLLSQLTTEARPRMTWYSGEERAELSGHVLDNWVTKVANFLVEEYQAGPDTRVVLDLPVHWRTVVWAMAVWRVGACLVVGPDTGRVHVVVTDRPADQPADRADAAVVALGLPALARTFDGELPVGVVDATTAVMTYGDVLTWMPEPDPIGPAIETRTATVRFDQLVGWADGLLESNGGAGRGARVLLEGAGGRQPQADALALTLAVYLRDGSVVLHVPDVAGPTVDRIAQTELVTDRIDLAS